MVKKKSCLIVILILGFWATAQAQAVRWTNYYYVGRAYSVIYGGDGNIYAAGLCTHSQIADDFTVISLTNTGNRRWAYRYNIYRPRTGKDGANSIAYGPDGNIYVAGYTANSDSNLDFTVISLTDSGTERWVYTYNSGNSNDQALSITCGSDSNLYAAGVSGGGFTVISLTTTGAERWAYRSSGIARSIIYGSDSNIYVGGDSKIISLTDTGNVRWVFMDTGFSRINSLVFGSDGNIYATGNGWTSYTWLYVTLSLTNGGNERWLNRRRAYDSSYACGNSITYGLDGNVYATGNVFIDPYEGGDIVVRSFTSNGSTRFEYVRPSYSTADGGISLVYGLDNNIYVAGMLGESYAIIFSLTSSGSNNWEFLHYAWGVTSMVYGPDSNLYFGGWTIGFSVASLTSHTGIAEDKEAKNIPGQIKVPAYFSNEIKIRNDKTADSPFKVEIYNIQGALVYQKRFALSEPNINIGGYEIASLSPGVYFLSFTTGETTTTHKIVKINSN